MGQAYWSSGMAERQAAFYVSFRKHPFEGNFTVAAGLHEVIEYLNHWQLQAGELDYLAQQKTLAGDRLFSEGYLDYLAKLRFTGDLDAVPEGELIFPHEPILTIKAPIIQAQLLETALINLINFPTLVATKAARCRAAAGDSAQLIDFGLRRAHTPYAGLIAARAAFIGGCEASSNVQAGYQYGIPLQGTQAHSWIMAFADELSAFQTFTEALPGHAVLLVDTYHTIEGIKHAIEVGYQLQNQGHRLWAIRIDSGDLEALSKQARKMLDQEGFSQTKIIVSGDLDEHRIAALKKREAPIDGWGVGTRLVTSYDQPSLDIVYKLSAIQDEHRQWQARMKLSAQPDKMTLPGRLQVLRQREAGTGGLRGDRIQLIDEPIDAGENLLQPVFRSGELVYRAPDIAQFHRHCRHAVRQFLADWQDKDYPVGLSDGLQTLKTDTIHAISNQ